MPSSRASVNLPGPTISVCRPDEVCREERRVSALINLIIRRLLSLESGRDRVNGIGDCNCVTLPANNAAHTARTRARAYSNVHISMMH